MARKRRQKKSGGGKLGKRPYDVKMIRDFFEHLLWECRIMHFEHVNPGALNPELVDQLAKYVAKYDVYGLQPHHFLDCEGVSDTESERAMMLLNAILLTKYEKRVNDLEATCELIEEALEIAELRSKTAQSVTVKARELLDAADAADEPESE